MRSQSKVREMRVSSVRESALPDALRHAARDGNHGDRRLIHGVAKAMVVPAAAIAIAMAPGVARADNSSCLATEQNLNSEISDSQKSMDGAQPQLQQFLSVQNPNSAVQASIALLQQLVSADQAKIKDAQEQLSSLQCDQPQTQPDTQSTGQQPSQATQPATTAPQNTDSAPQQPQAPSQPVNQTSPSPAQQSDQQQPDPVTASQPATQAQVDPNVTIPQSAQVSAPSIDSYNVSIAGGYNIYGHGMLWDVSGDSLQIYWSNVETSGSGMQIYMAKSKMGSGDLRNINSSIISDIDSSSFAMVDTSGYGLAQGNGPNIMYSVQDIARKLGIDVSDWGTTYKTIFVAIVDPTAEARTQYFAVPLHAMVQQSDVTANGSVPNANAKTIQPTTPTDSVTEKVDGQTTLQKTDSVQGVTIPTNATAGTGAQKTTTTVGNGTTDPAKKANATQTIGAAKDAGTVVGVSGDTASKLGKITGNDMLKAFGEDMKSVSDAISIVTRDTVGIGETAMGEGGDYGLVGALAGLIDAEYGNSLSKALGAPDYRLCDPALLFSACRK